MTSQLVILNGIETGVEIGIEPDRIYSIGNGDDADFYLQSDQDSFLVLFKVLGESIEWWAKKKTAITYNGESIALTFTAQSLPNNGIVQVAGRDFGIFSDKQALVDAKARVAPVEPDLPVLDRSNSVEEHSGPAAQDMVEPKISEASVAHSAEAFDEINSDDNAPDLHAAAEELAPEKSDLSEDKTSGFYELGSEPEKEVVPEGTPALKAIPVPDSHGTQEKERKEAKQKKDTILKYMKMLPFALGIFIAIGYGAVQYQAKTASAMKVQIEKNDARDKEREDAQLDQADEDQLDMMAGSSSRDSNSMDASSQGEDSAMVNADSEAGLYASGAEYGASSKDWAQVEGAATSGKSQLETLRQEINDNNFDKEVAKEMLFPDEKMMTLIKEMLDTAGAEGIDVRFDRGSYDVFGFVMDDAKWQRIFKILTFDLDLSKVRFSVETSVSLITKLEALLKKFNLSEYVILSLASNGEIYAKTYYPPALEGLWLTIVNRFESKYSPYTEIKEYRAHVGWIQVVKVSFDQPSYILLADGRRVVEGSVIGGDSVLDRIFEDSIRVTSATTNIRYYVINRQSTRTAAELSYR